MLKVELENLLGYEIEQKDFEQLNKMYMNCDLEKYEFAKIVKPAKKQKEIKIVAVVNEYYQTKYYTLVDISIKKGKYIVRELKQKEKEKRLDKYGFMNTDCTAYYYQIEIN